MYLLATRVYKNTIICKLDTSKYYTLIIKLSDLNGGVDISICDSNQANSAFYVRATSNGYFVRKFKPTNDIANMLWIWNMADTNLTYTIEDAMIIESDLTSNPPNGYIEGLKSVGQDATKIVVSSVKGDGNLFDKDILYPTLKALNPTYVALETVENRNCIKITSGIHYYLNTYFNKNKFKSSTQYTFRFMAKNYTDTTTAIGFTIYYTDGTRTTGMLINTSTFTEYKMTSAIGKTVSYISITHDYSSKVCYIDLDTIST